MMRTIKMAWKELLAIAVLAALVSYSAYELYCGWAYHDIDFPSRHSSASVSLEYEPKRFAISVTVYVTFMLSFSWGMVVAIMSLRKRRANASLDGG